MVGRFHRTSVATGTKTGPAPVFDVSISVKLNDIMVEQLVDLFDDAVAARIPIKPETWALYKQLENIVGQKEKE